MEKDKCSNNIIAVFQTNEDNETIRIINSFEEVRREKTWIIDKEEYHNENEIKENCEIRINNEIIPFSYKYKFNIKGKHTIKFAFKNKMMKTNLLFCNCKSMVNIDLSNFNTQNVTVISGMFSGCSSLTNIDLSNFNTQNVIYMGGMFYECSSLTNIDLSNFNIQNVTNISWMFNRCNSLIKKI